MSTTPTRLRATTGHEKGLGVGLTRASLLVFTQDEQGRRLRPLDSVCPPSRGSNVRLPVQGGISGTVVGSWESAVWEVKNGLDLCLRVIQNDPAGERLSTFTRFFQTRGEGPYLDVVTPVFFTANPKGTRSFLEGRLDELTGDEMRAKWGALPGIIEEELLVQTPGWGEVVTRHATISSRPRTTYRRVKIEGKERVACRVVRRRRFEV